MRAHTRPGHQESTCRRGLVVLEGIAADGGLCFGLDLVLVVGIALPRHLPDTSQPPQHQRQPSQHPPASVRTRFSRSSRQLPCIFTSLYCRLTPQMSCPRVSALPSKKNNRTESRKNTSVDAAIHAREAAPPIRREGPPATTKEKKKPYQPQALSLIRLRHEGLLHLIVGRALTRHARQALLRPRQQLLLYPATRLKGLGCRMKGVGCGVWGVGDF